MHAFYDFILLEKKHIDLQNENMTLYFSRISWPQKNTNKQSIVYFLLMFSLKCGKNHALEN